MTPTSPSTSFQAHRYARLGYGELFSNPISLALSELMVSCCACCREVATAVAEFKNLDPSELDDVQRVLRHLERDFSDGVLLVVAPTANQLAQIQEDGIRLHHSRLELLVTVLEGMAQYGDERSACRLRQTVDLLRTGGLVVIKTV